MVDGGRASARRPSVGRRATRPGFGRYTTGDTAAVGRRRRRHLEPGGRLPGRATPGSGDKPRGGSGGESGRCRPGDRGGHPADRTIQRNARQPRGDTHARRPALVRAHVGPPSGRHPAGGAGRDLLVRGVVPASPARPGTVRGRVQGRPPRSRPGRHLPPSGRTGPGGGRGDRGRGTRPGRSRPRTTAPRRRAALFPRHRLRRGGRLRPRRRGAGRMGRPP